MRWYRTGKGNLMATIDGCQVIIFMRQWGWSYTVRIDTGSTWVQESAKSDQYWDDPKDCMKVALIAQKRIKNLYCGIIVPMNNYSLDNLFDTLELKYENYPD